METSFGRFGLWAVGRIGPRITLLGHGPVSTWKPTESHGIRVTSVTPRGNGPDARTARRARADRPPRIDHGSTARRADPQQVEPART